MSTRIYEKLWVSAQSIKYLLTIDFPKKVVRTYRTNMYIIYYVLPNNYNQKYYH